MKIALAVAVLLPLLASAMPGGGLLGGFNSYIAKPQDAPVVFAVQKINEKLQATSSNANLRSVQEILTATRQVVAGYNYNFRLEMTGGIKTEICDIKLFQGLDNHMEITQLHCADKAVNPTTPLAQGYVGAEAEANWENVVVQEAVAVLVDHINENVLRNKEYRFVPSGPPSVTKQVVNGFLLRFKDLNMLETTCLNSDSTTHGKVSLKDCPAMVNSNQAPTICQGTIYWNPRSNPTNKPENVTCQAMQAPVARAQQPMLGAPQVVLWTSDGVQNALAHLTDNINRMSNNMYRVLATGGQVTRQLVNGNIFRFSKVAMVETSCTNTNAQNNGKVSLVECPENENSIMSPQQCEGTVTTDLLQQTYQVTNVVCQNPTPKAQVVGGNEETIWMDVDVQKALVAATDAVNSNSNNMYRAIFTPGTVTKQVVNGIIYKFHSMYLVDTTCLNNDVNSIGKVTLTECPHNMSNTKDPQRCDAEVYWNPRLPVPYTINVMNCEAPSSTN